METDWNYIRRAEAAADQMNMAADRIEHYAQRISSMLEDVRHNIHESAGVNDSLTTERVCSELRQGAFVLDGLSPCGGFLQIDTVEAGRIAVAMHEAAAILAAKEQK